MYWYVGTAAVINYGGGVMVGNIIANSGYFVITWLVPNPF
jgi:hypothetical protein